MDWSGTQDWVDPKVYQRALWMVNDYPAGWSKTLHNLTFLVVYNSGHLVPYNVPVQALDLVERLVTNHSFNDVKIPFLFPNYQPDTKKNQLENFVTGGGSHDAGSGGGGRFMYILFGFLAGAAAVLLYVKVGKKKHSHQYEHVGEVEETSVS